MRSKNAGLQNKVVKYYLKHPELLENSDNSIVYNKFQAETQSEKATVRNVKSKALKQYKQSQDTTDQTTKETIFEEPTEAKEEERPNQNNLPALPDDFLELWQTDKDVLKAIIANYKQTTSINFVLSEQDFEPEKPFKTFSYSLSEKLHESFGAICKELKVSKRKGVHLALKGFIDFYNK